LIITVVFKNVNIHVYDDIKKTHVFIEIFEMELKYFYKPLQTEVITYLVTFHICVPIGYTLSIYTENIPKQKTKKKFFARPQIY